MALNKTSLALLVAIGAAMQGEPGYMFATEKQAKPLTDEGLAEFNSEISDGDKFAIRLTDAGLAQLPAEDTKEDKNMDTVTASAPASSGVQVFSGGFTPSRKTRGGRKGTSYPFDTLEVGGFFFFIPATADKPEPAKSIASTVNSAVKRHAELAVNEDGSPQMETYKVKGEEKTRQKLNPTRDFAVQSVENGVTYGEWTAPSDGAVVYRTA